MPVYDTTNWTVLDSGTDAELDATRSGLPGMAHVVTGLSISCNGAPTGPLTAQLTDGTDVLDEWRIPAAAFAPIIHNFTYPIRLRTGKPATLTLSEAGADITAAITLRGYTVKGG